MLRRWGIAFSRRQAVYSFLTRRELEGSLPAHAIPPRPSCPLGFPGRVAKHVLRCLVPSNALHVFPSQPSLQLHPRSPHRGQHPAPPRDRFHPHPASPPAPPKRHRSPPRHRVDRRLVPILVVRPRGPHPAAVRRHDPRQRLLAGRLPDRLQRRPLRPQPPLRQLPRSLQPHGRQRGAQDLRRPRPRRARVHGLGRGPPAPDPQRCVPHLRSMHASISPLPFWTLD